MLVNDDCIEDENFILYLNVINGGRKNGSFFKLMDEGYARERNGLSCFWQSFTFLFCNIRLVSSGVSMFLFWGGNKLEWEKLEWILWPFRVITFKMYLVSLDPSKVGNSPFTERKEEGMEFSFWVFLAQVIIDKRIICSTWSEWAIRCMTHGLQGGRERRKWERERVWERRD